MNKLEKNLFLIPFWTLFVLFFSVLMELGCLGHFNNQRGIPIDYLVGHGEVIKLVLMAYSGLCTIIMFTIISALVSLGVAIIMWAISVAIKDGLICCWNALIKQIKGTWNKTPNPSV